MAKPDEQRKNIVVSPRDDKSYLIEVPDPHKVENQSDKELHLPRHSVLKINNSIKVRRVLTEAAELHG